ncbi:NAD(P)/FAD-dependent oxidoreductase [Kamptonema sp. UHCC 0994]|uniref:NAD(P)/FAD-dependent oxidoreductase n=1 Tax=Kamptonema sp. UHCC 0994 TaxID=3031329 RepID=UPI0023BA4C44|nr:NAD(P)/FAD-dependent oxidoreductase [Kamptonema sp. UHCC 0994]MDF0556521.1 NAD(P)/FAD-dependent oxidoreductase [Kamptonema sp. UHCC 0994]
MSDKFLRVVVVGGGAAGFFGAIAAAKAHPQTRITLLEAGRELLAKVRISGGGRCNVTHACFDPGILVQNYPRGGKALRGAFTRFQPHDTVEWFASQGVKLKTEEDGRMFPTTDDSGTIVNTLIQAAKDAGVEIRTGVAAVSINRLTTNFEIELKSGEKLKCDRILLATGSSPSGFKWAKNLGHTIQSPVPSLFTFNISDVRLQDLAGVSVGNVRVQLPAAKLEQTGPILITHWGLSGPAVLKLSAWGARFLHECRYQTSLLINWLPQYKPDVLRQQLLAVKSQLPRRAISTSCPLPIPRRLWERLTVAVGIDSEKRWSELSNKSLNQLIQELSQGEYQIKGKGAFKEEFVTCGGVNLKEIDFKTMESRCCPGLYFAGEILDIDGVTGGFNFQSAWTTGWLAGLGLTQVAQNQGWLH